MLTNLLKRSNSILYGAIRKTNNISFVQISSQKFFGKIRKNKKFINNKQNFFKNYLEIFY